MQYRAGMIGTNFAIAPDKPRGTVVCVTREEPLTGVSMTGTRYLRSEI
jgi:hypothetical protein